MQEIRGKIHARERAKQLRDFSGLRYGNITATDVDGLIEYHGKGYIFIEVKLNDALLPYGQKLAFERLVDDLKKPAICIIASHDVDNPNKDINVAHALVSEYRFKGNWLVPKSEYTVRALIDLFIDKVLGGNLE